MPERDQHGRVNLQFWSYGAEEYWSEAAQRFMTVHSDVNVICDIPTGTQDHGKSLLITRIAAGNPPDVVVVDDIDLPAYAQSAVVEALDEFMAHDADYRIDDFAPSMVRDGTVNGKHYAVPWYGSVVQITYRSDLFARAGVEPPRTWEDILAVAGALQAKCGLQYPFAMDWLAAFYYANFIWQNGGEIVAPDGRTLLFGSQEVVGALQWVHDLMYRHQIVDPALAQGTNYQDLWAQGEVAFMVDGSWNIGLYDEKFPELAGKWWVAPLPRHERQVTFYGGQQMAMCAKSRHPEVAWQFISFVTDAAMQMEWVRRRGQPPSNMRVFDLPALYEEQPALAFIKDVLPHGKNFPIEPWFQKVYYEVFQAALERIMGDPEADVAAVMQQANRDAQAIVDAELL